MAIKRNKRYQSARKTSQERVKARARLRASQLRVREARVWLQNFGQRAKHARQEALAASRREPAAGAGIGGVEESKSEPDPMVLAVLRKILGKPGVKLFTAATPTTDETRKIQELHVVLKKQLAVLYTWEFKTEGAIGEVSKQASDFLGRQVSVPDTRTDTKPFDFEELGKSCRIFTKGGRGRLFCGSVQHERGPRAWLDLAVSAGWDNDKTVLVVETWSEAGTHSKLTVAGGAVAAAPKIVGHGTNGCIYRPYVPCRSKRLSGGPFVSKFVNSRREIDELERVKAVDPDGRYTIQMADHCKVSRLPRTAKRCGPLMHSRPPFFNIVIQDGGVDMFHLFKAATTESDVKKILAALRNTVEGLVAFSRAGFVHGDIKLPNIVAPPLSDKAKFIDFGLSFVVATEYGEWPTKNWEFFNGMPCDRDSTTFYLFWPPEIVAQAQIKKLDDDVSCNTMRQILQEYNRALRRQFAPSLWSEMEIKIADYELANSMEDLSAGVYDDGARDLAAKFTRGIDVFSLGMSFWMMADVFDRKFSTTVPSLRPSLQALKALARHMTKIPFSERFTAPQALEFYDNKVLAALAK